MGSIMAKLEEPLEPRYSEHLTHKKYGTHEKWSVAHLYFSF